MTASQHVTIAPGTRIGPYQIQSAIGAGGMGEAADGKTRTVTTTGKNAQGQTVNNVAMYDRQ